MKHTKQKDLFFFQYFIANKTFNLSYDMSTKTHQQRVYSLALCHKKVKYQARNTMSLSSHHCKILITLTKTALDENLMSTIPRSIYKNEKPQFENDFIEKKNPFQQTTLNKEEKHNI